MKIDSFNQSSFPKLEKANAMFYDCVLKTVRTCEMYRGMIAHWFNMWMMP